MSPRAGSPERKSAPYTADTVDGARGRVDGREEERWHRRKVRGREGGREES